MEKINERLFRKQQTWARRQIRGLDTCGNGDFRQQLARKHTHAHTNTHTLTHSNTLAHVHLDTPTCTQSHSCTLSVWLAVCLSVCLSHTLTRSLAHSLTHSLTRSLTLLFLPQRDARARPPRHRRALRRRPRRRRRRGALVPTPPPEGRGGRRRPARDEHRRRAETGRRRRDIHHDRLVASIHSLNSFRTTHRKKFNKVRLLCFQRRRWAVATSTERLSRSRRPDSCGRSRPSGSSSGLFLVSCILGL